jgi:hypothetical protein
VIDPNRKYVPSFLASWQPIRVNEMPVAHVLVLLALLLKSHHAPLDWAAKWLFSSVHSQMIVKGVFRLAASATMLTLEGTLAKSVIGVQRPC